MDVHKSFVVACIATTDDKGVTIYKKKRFSTFTSDLRRCASWLEENNCKDVCMESTGKYWIPVYNTLESTCQIVLAHPKYVKAIRGKKTDEKDAKWIADIFKHGLVSGSFIPPADITSLGSNVPRCSVTTKSFIRRFLGSFSCDNILANNRSLVNIFGTNDSCNFLQPKVTYHKFQRRYVTYESIFRESESTYQSEST